LIELESCVCRRANLVVPVMHFYPGTPMHLFSGVDSPDLNPIEQAFAKLKALLRAKALRTVEALWNALGDVVACFSSAECANFLRHAGYF
jgi:hypothetical protein